MNKKLIVFSVFTLLATTVTAEDMNTKIKELYTYVGGGIDGDIAVRTTDTSSICTGGFYVKNTESTSHKNMVSFLLSAYHAKAKVRLIGEPIPWAGSGAPWCQLNTVGLVP